ncbi:quinone-dependent dihydroorotate dehydrogenase [bacterium]|nr:quinone-dependent dihydroorotate dehydrogenase [bacterium]
MSYRIFWPILAMLPPETAHGIAVAALRVASAVPGARGLLASGAPTEALAVDTLRLHFPTPVGLAAGFDKAASAYGPLARLGFGFVEVGTVTALAQPGNPRPRLFRLPADRALVNRMGFNNPGAAAVGKRFARRGAGVVGINIGKSKATPPERAAEDYAASTRLLAPHADYLVVNVSSPNTPGLRDLQAIDALREIMTAVRKAAGEARPGERSRLPLLVKIAPDLTDEDVEAVGRFALDFPLDGLIATNTTIARGGLATPAERVAKCGAGGLSGPPLASRSMQVLRILRRVVGDKVTLVASGGIETGRDAFERILAGASLVQIYTSFVYAGPRAPVRIANELLAAARDAGYDRVADAIGKGA